MYRARRQKLTALQLKHKINQGHLKSSATPTGQTRQEVAHRLVQMICLPDQEYLSEAPRQADREDFLGHHDTAPRLRVAALLCHPAIRDLHQLHGADTVLADGVAEVVQPVSRERPEGEDLLEGKQDLADHLTLIVKAGIMAIMQGPAEDTLHPQHRELIESRHQVLVLFKVLQFFRVGEAVLKVSQHTLGERLCVFSRSFVEYS